MKRWYDGDVNLVHGGTFYAQTDETTVEFIEIDPVTVIDYLDDTVLIVISTGYLDLDAYDDKARQIVRDSMEVPTEDTWIKAWYLKNYDANIYSTHTWKVFKFDYEDSTILNLLKREGFALNEKYIEESDMDNT